MAKIYVASSWRNQHYPEVVTKLRNAGHEVYDFRNPSHGQGGFKWQNLDPNFDKWGVEEYKQGLLHPSSERQFQADLDALNWADTCLLVLPCGRSAHTEAGWMKGTGKRTIVYIPQMEEAELMYKLFDLVSGDLNEVLDYLKPIEQNAATVANSNSPLFIAFNITTTYDLMIQGKGDRDSIYHCTRYHWANVRIEKAELADFALGVAHGKVVGVFKPKRWFYDEPGNRKSRIQFEGIEIEDSPYLGMDLSEYFSKIQNPVRYIGAWGK